MIVIFFLFNVLHGSDVNSTISNNITNNQTISVTSSSQEWQHFVQQNKTATELIAEWWARRGENKKKKD